MRNLAVLTCLLPLLLLTAPLVAGEQETLVLKVEGMTSSCCEDIIRWVLFDKVEGVGDIDARHQEGVVTIRFDPDRVPVAALVKKVNDAPSFRVTGSTSHALDPSLLKKKSTTRGTGSPGTACPKSDRARKKPAEKP